MMSHNEPVGVDGLTPLQRWFNHDAPYKAMCPKGLCVSYEHVIYCQECVGMVLVDEEDEAEA